MKKKKVVKRDLYNRHEKSGERDLICGSGRRRGGRFAD